MKLKIEYVKKDELKPYVNNAKLHPAGQVEQIKKSIEEFGFNDPIAVWGENEIVEGHGRLLAVMEMDNIDSVPVIRLDDLTNEQRKAYTLVHNKLTMNTGFDFGLLDIELEAISDIDMSEFGFDISEYLPEPYDEEMLSNYDEHAEGFLIKKRVMITYSDGQEQLIADLLGVEKDKIKILYDISELVKGKE